MQRSTSFNHSNSSPLIPSSGHGQNLPSTTLKLPHHRQFSSRGFMRITVWSVKVELVKIAKTGIRHVLVTMGLRQADDLRFFCSTRDQIFLTSNTNTVTDSHGCLFRVWHSEKICKISGNQQTLWTTSGYGLSTGQGLIPRVNYVTFLSITISSSLK